MRKVWLVTFVTILLTVGSSLLLPPLRAQSSTETVAIDAGAKSTPLPHFWEHMFGSGRAILSMRQSYRDALRRMKGATGIQYVRFHAILDDEVGVYDEDAQGNPVFNFSYIDQIYDGLLANGVRPFVELSFMPNKLAAHIMLHAFWYKPDISPPKDYGKWDALISQLAKHLVERYGIEEVSQWYFEVWNEPNLDFWGGNPKQATYFELYDHTARALKAVNSRLRVGGPATAQAAWADAFIQHCAENKVPVDFVSSHVYGNDKAEDVFGTHEKIPRDQMVCRAVAKVHDQIKSSAMPDLPLIWSEFNASYMNETDVTDSAYMGPYLADTIRQCDGLVNEMSYWTFSDVFEEQGVIKKPFYGGYGAIAEDDIPKPAFDAFVLLHSLGEKRLAVSSNDVLATIRSDGTLVIAAWNLAAPGAMQAPEKEIKLEFQHVKVSSVELRRVDSDHGDVRTTYKKMDSPRYPSKEQIEELRAAARLSSPETQKLESDSVTLKIPGHGLVVVEAKPGR